MQGQAPDGLIGEQGQNRKEYHVDESRTRGTGGASMFEGRTRMFMRMGAGLLMAAMILFASWNICNSQESATRKVFVFQGADGLGVYVARILPSSDEALVKIWGIGNHRWNNRIFRCRIVESGNAKTFVTSLEEKVRVYWADDPERVKAVRSFEGMASVFRMNAIVGKGNPQETELGIKALSMTTNELAEFLDKQTHDSLCSVASCKFYFHHAREIQYSSCLSNKALARSLLDEYQKQ